MMKRYLKNYTLTVDRVEEAIYDCLKHKWKRKDVSYFLAEYSGETGNIHVIAKRCRELARLKETREALKYTIRNAAECLYAEIENRFLVLKPIEYQFRYDESSGKVRKIGISSIKQQVFDYIAVNACKDMFMAKFGRYQCASIPGRGQVYGKKTIEKWVRKDRENSRYHYKCDIKQYYLSVNLRVLKKFLRHDIANNDILYLIFRLLSTYEKGLCIGSYLSQYLANYYMSYAYHFITEQSYSIRVKKNGETIRINNAKHVIFYMDDIEIFSSSLKLLKRAVRDFERYISDVLKLEIKPTTHLYSTSKKPVDMMGFVVYRNKTILRDKIYKNIFRLFLRLVHRKRCLSLRIARKVISYNGWLDHSDLYVFKERFHVEKFTNKAKKVVQFYDKNSFYRNAEELRLLSA